MSKRDPLLLLNDILEATDKIIEYTNDMDYDAFVNDYRTKDAVIRNLEIIGEAANQLPDEFKIEYENIEWKKIIGVRNRIIHEYFGVDYDIVWEIIQNNIVDLKEKINSIVSLL